MKKSSWYGQKRKERMEIRIEPALKELLDDLALANEMTLSDYVRTLCIRDVRRNWKKIEFK